MTTTPNQPITRPTATTAPQVKCPSCQTSIEWSTDNPNRPFCSERCRNEDFIGWAKQEKVLPGDSGYDEVFSGDLHDSEGF